MENSSNSFLDEDEEEIKVKMILIKKYNGLEEKRKFLWIIGFYLGFLEVVEKRIKFLNNFDERF